MITAAKFYGGAKGVNTGSDFASHPKLARVYRVQTLGGGFFLPDARYLAKGGPHIIVINASGGAITVADALTTNTWSVANGWAYRFTLLDNSTEDGRWQAFSAQVNTGRTANHIARSTIAAIAEVTPLVVDCVIPAWKLVACQTTPVHANKFTRTDLSLYVGKVIRAQDKLYYSVSTATAPESETEDMTTITVDGGPFDACPAEETVTVASATTAFDGAADISSIMHDFDERRIRVQFTTFVVADRLVLTNSTGTVLFDSGMVTTLSDWAAGGKLLTVRPADLPLHAAITIGDVGSGYLLEITGEGPTSFG
jgi:hypothetical protein